jgi:hypothetical protein
MVTGKVNVHPPMSYRAPTEANFKLRYSQQMRIYSQILTLISLTRTLANPDPKADPKNPNPKEQRSKEVMEL